MGRQRAARVVAVGRTERHLRRPCPAPTHPQPRPPAALAHPPPEPAICRNMPLPATSSGVVSVTHAELAARLAAARGKLYSGAPSSPQFVCWCRVMASWPVGAWLRAKVTL